MIQLKTTSYALCAFKHIFNLMNSDSHTKIVQQVVISVTFSLGSLLLELRNENCLEIVHRLKSNQHLHYSNLAATNTLRVTL